MPVVLEVRRVPRVLLPEVLSVPTVHVPSAIPGTVGTGGTSTVSSQRTCSTFSAITTCGASGT